VRGNIKFGGDGLLGGVEVCFGRKVFCFIWEWAHGQVLGCKKKGNLSLIAGCRTYVGVRDRFYVLWHLFFRSIQEENVVVVVKSSR
jgi:hypothetical protein